MPRPNKPINPGQPVKLVVASRGSVWNKHAGPENAAQYEPDGRIFVDEVSRETFTEVVTEVDVRNDTPVVTVAPQIAVKVIETIPSKVIYDWQSERSIEGRTYRRMDQLVPIDEVVDL